MKEITATSLIVRDQASKTHLREPQTIAKARISKSSKKLATPRCSIILKITGKWLHLIQERWWMSTICIKIRPGLRTFRRNKLSINRGRFKTVSSSWDIYQRIINKLVHPRKSKIKRLLLPEVVLKTELRIWSVEWKFKWLTNDLGQQTTTTTQTTRSTHRHSLFRSIALAKIERLCILKTSTPRRWSPMEILLKTRIEERYSILRIHTNLHLLQSAWNRC